MAEDMPGTMAARFLGICFLFLIVEDDILISVE